VVLAVVGPHALAVLDEPERFDERTALAACQLASREPHRLLWRTLRAHRLGMAAPDIARDRASGAAPLAVTMEENEKRQRPGPRAN
jgi:hypothetical protein